MHIYNGFDCTYLFTSESGGKIRLGSAIVSMTTLSAQLLAFHLLAHGNILPTAVHFQHVVNIVLE
jgi:hypothetical protein